MTKTKYLIIPLLILLFHFSCNSPYTKGEQIYELHCANCHGKNGEGMRKLYPPINAELYSKYREDVACMVRYGINDSLKYNNITYSAEMPPNDILSDIDIVNIINFLDWKYTSDTPYNSLKDVKIKLASCK